MTTKVIREENNLELSTRKTVFANSRRLLRRRRHRETVEAGGRQQRYLSSLCIAAGGGKSRLASTLHALNVDLFTFIFPLLYSESAFSSHAQVLFSC